MSTRLLASSRPIVMPSDTNLLIGQTFIVLDFVSFVLILVEFVVVVAVVENRPSKKDGWKTTVLLEW